MAVSNPSVAQPSAPLLLYDTVDDAVDYKNRPAYRSNTGGWRSASFIIGVEVAERFAYYGISSNLITYLTDQLGESTATAAENVNVWSGTASLLPVVGAFVADSFLGRYRTIVVASMIYILGLGLMTLAAMLPSISTTDCENSNVTLCATSQLQVSLLFFSLYLVAIGQGGHKPCVQAFGADQFDGHNAEERRAKSSFFNWWYFALCAGSTVTMFVVTYIQDNLSWVLGFGVPCISMIVALVVFLLGTTTYRYSVSVEKSPFVRIGGVFVAALKNWRMPHSAVALEEEASGKLPHQKSEQFKFLNKALLPSDGLEDDRKTCSTEEVEEAKAVLRLLPVWAAGLMYAIAYAQSSTFFTKQGATMDRSIAWGFEIPAAALQCFGGIAIVLTIPLYDRVFIPVARALTRRPSGITMLQRIGIGMFFSIISMIIAALVEMKRLKTAEEYGLVDSPDETVPMSVWWLVPQYCFFGVADVFTMVGWQEFFYDQVPSDLRSIGLSFYLSIIGIGSFLSSFLVSIIDEITSSNGGDSWLADNLNKAHLDYFYWLLAALGVLGLAAHLYVAKSYVYKKG